MVAAMVSSPLSTLERERMRETEQTGEREHEGERALGLMQLGVVMWAQGRCMDGTRHAGTEPGRPLHPPGRFKSSKD
jgi:hypothetical protein